MICIYKIITLSYYLKQLFVKFVIVSLQNLVKLRVSMLKPLITISSICYGWN